MISLINPSDAILARKTARETRALPKISEANGLPHHEIVQRLPGFVRDKSDNGRVIDEAEKRSLVRNQIEWVDQVTESSYDPHQSIIRNLLVFPALVRADQPQHRQKIRPIFLEGLARERRRLSRGLFKKRAQTAGTDDTQFCFAERPGKCRAAQGRFLIGNVPFGGRFCFRFFHLAL